MVSSSLPCSFAAPPRAAESAGRESPNALRGRAIRRLRSRIDLPGAQNASVGFASIEYVAPMALPPFISAEDVADDESYSNKQKDRSCESEPERAIAVAGRYDEEPDNDTSEANQLHFHQVEVAMSSHVVAPFSVVYVSVMKGTNLGMRSSLQRSAACSTETMATPR